MDESTLDGIRRRGDLVQRVVAQLFMPSDLKPEDAAMFGADYMLHTTLVCLTDDGARELVEVVRDYVAVLEEQAA